MAPVRVALRQQAGRQMQLVESVGLVCLVRLAQDQMVLPVQVAQAAGLERQGQQIDLVLLAAGLSVAQARQMELVALRAQLEATRPALVRQESEFVRLVAD